MRKGSLPYVKQTGAKGRRYDYFRTGVFDARGKEILKRLPPRADPAFATVYASLLAGRTRRANVAAELKLSRLIELYEKSPEFRHLAPSSQRTYSHYLARLADQLAPAPARGVEPRDIILLRDAAADTPGAANGLVRSARALFAWAKSPGREYVERNPCDGIVLFPSKDYEPWPDDLLAEALASDDPKIRVPVALLYFAAQRIGDTCALRWSDIREDRVKLSDQKTDTELDFPVHRDLATILATVPKAGLTILAEDAGRPVRVGAVRERLQKFAADRGHKIVPHGLRKNAINALLEVGCSLAEIAGITGQSMGTIEHYAKRRNRAVLGSAAVLKWEGAKA